MLRSFQVVIMVAPVTTMVIMMITVVPVTMMIIMVVNVIMVDHGGPLEPTAKPGDGCCQCGEAGQHLHRRLFRNCIIR